MSNTEALIATLQIVLKTLMVFHRFMRDCPASTKIYQRLFPNLHEFRIPRFLDDTSSEGMQASMLVRNYALYMEEKLQVFTTVWAFKGS